MHLRLKAAWNALRGRPTVAFTHFTGTLYLAPGTRGAVIVGNRFTPP